MRTIYLNKGYSSKFPLVCTYPPSILRLIFKQSTAGLESESAFQTGRHTKTKESNLPYYLPIVGRKRNEFMLFPKILEQSEMQTASFRF